MRQMERNYKCSRAKKKRGEVTDHIFSHIVHLHSRNVLLLESLLLKFQVQKTSHHREGERDERRRKMPVESFKLYYMLR